MHEQKCPKCGAECEGEYLGDHPCIDYSCECGYAWCDTDEYMNMMADQADNLRKAAKEGI